MSSSSLKKNESVSVDSHGLIVNGLYLFYHGPLSNWYMEEFVHEGVTYNCGEQWMMACKARLFHDDNMLEQIMSCEEPRKQKALGRLVENFDGDVWMKEADDLLFPGLVAKFMSSAHCRKALLSTQDNLIVEASPFDTIWGIGLKKDSYEARDRKKWKGLNKLGHLLTRVREQVKINLDRAKLTCGQKEEIKTLSTDEKKEDVQPQQSQQPTIQPVNTPLQSNRARKGSSLLEAIAANSKRKQDKQSV